MNRLLASIKPLWFLACVAVVIFAIHTATIRDYPACWFDEIEIMETGRSSVFERPVSWSVVMSPRSGTELGMQLPLFHYLAGSIQEALYRSTDSYIPSRLFFLLSLVSATLLLFGWLRCKGLSTTVALFVSCIFLVDPNVTICAHWYRPDLWGMSLLFASLILLHKAVDASSLQKSIIWVSVGAITALNFFFWITSVLFFPLLLIELWSTVPHRCQSLLKAVIMMVVGGVAMAAICLIPLYALIPVIIQNYLTGSEIGRVGQAITSDQTVYAQRLFDFIKIALRSPLVWTGAVLGCCFMLRRSTLHVVGFLVVCAFILATNVYHLRMVYLMPFLFLLLAVASQHMLEMRLRWLRNLVIVGLCATVGLYITISVIGMTYGATVSTTNYQSVTAALKENVGTGPLHVYLYDVEHEFYYSGRELGWSMYSYINRENVFEPSQSANLLNTLDAVVFTETLRPSVAQQAILHKNGFVKTADVRFPQTIEPVLRQKIASTIYAHGYPAFEVWKRQASAR